MEDDNGELEGMAGTEDLGEPIQELEGFEDIVSPGFMGRIRSALDRRSLAGNLVTLAWSASARALFEFLKMIFSVFDTDRTTKGGSD